MSHHHHNHFFRNLLLWNIFANASFNTGSYSGGGFIPFIIILLIISAIIGVVTWLVIKYGKPVDNNNVTFVPVTPARHNIVIPIN